MFQPGCVVGELVWNASNHVKGIAVDLVVFSGDDVREASFGICRIDVLSSAFSIGLCNKERLGQESKSFPGALNLLKFRWR